jgi:hypothetical protein
MIKTYLKLFSKYNKKPNMKVKFIVVVGAIRNIIVDSSLIALNPLTRE